MERQVAQCGSHGPHDSCVQRGLYPLFASSVRVLPLIVSEFNVGTLLDAF